MAAKRKGSERKLGQRSPALPENRMVAGIDIGSTEHWVCGPPNADGSPNVKVFGTTTDQLEALAAWVMQQKVESIAMESTYVYWIPVYEVLEARGVKVVLVNARALHNVPGRKTDYQDCQWLQLLHSRGLLRGSFRPPEAIAQIRAMQRQLASLGRDRTRYVQWMQKALDQMNVKVHRAVTDLTGTTGLAIVRAIVAGERDPAKLAALRDRRCGKSEQEIARYLTGTWHEEHLFNLTSALRLFDGIEKELAIYEVRLTKEFEKLQPVERQGQPVPTHPNPKKEKSIRERGQQETRTALWRFSGSDLTRIDGISATAAQTILVEVGMDLAAFPSEHHFVSWLRLCPRTAVSGGKPIKKRRNGLGSNRIAATLRMAATSIQRSKTALGAFYRRVARHKGVAVAVFATARKLASFVYRLLRFGHDYSDIGEAAYEERFKTRRLGALSSAAQSLGFALVPATNAEPHPA